MALFSFFKGDPSRERRETAAALLHQARKVWAYRRDVLAPELAERFQRARAGLAAAAADAAARGKGGAAATAASPDALAGEFDARIEEMHATLVEAGGKIYPLRLLPEWVELIIVAAIVACGVRSFFLQPFKIPTNSMYPTYHGMTAEVYPLDADGPGGLHRAWRKAVFWTERIEARANGGGEVIIPLRQFGDANARPQDRYDNGIFGTKLFRSSLDVFTLRVGGEWVEVEVPREFDFRRVVLRTYFPDEVLRARVSDAELRTYFPNVTTLSELHENERWKLVTSLFGDSQREILRTGVRVPPGGRVVNFDVLTGDLVLVNRFSYNFVRPKTGDPFVFATKNIPRLDPGQYYIKRLAGTPGDTLQIKRREMPFNIRRPERAPELEPLCLLRNRAPIELGTPNSRYRSAFRNNNEHRTDLEYFGYRAGEGFADEHRLIEPHTVSPAHYFAMGDNSAGSYDSRGWGEVPENAVIGRAFLILYPLSKRWGLAE